jgi:hypothetical protein
MTFDEWLQTKDGQVACVARNVAMNTGTQTDDALRLAWDAGYRVGYERGLQSAIEDD